MVSSAAQERVREMRRSRGRFERVEEQWVGCVGAELGEEEARYCLAVGRVPVAGLLLILCTAPYGVVRNKVR